MPYILEKVGQDLNEQVRRPENHAELNYLLSAIFADYIVDHGLSYDTINDILGASHAAQREFERRVVDSYEAGKQPRSSVVNTGRIDPYGVLDSLE